MRIIIPAMSAPKCYCGSKMEIYVDVYNQRLQVKCPYCAFEQSMFIPFDASSLTLRSVYNSTRSMME